MNDQRLTEELHDLERWFRSLPDPQLPDESIEHLKAVVTAKLLDVQRSSRAEPTQPSAEAMQRIRTRCRREIAQRQARSGVLRVMVPERLRWMMTAAASLLMVAGLYGLLHIQRPAAAAPAVEVQLSWWSPEISAIEAEISELERRVYWEDDLIYDPADEDEYSDGLGGPVRPVTHFNLDG